MNHFEALKLPKSIWAIGLVTLLMNVSTVIIFSLQPNYLVSVLGITTSHIGFLEGAVEFLSWLTRVFSGVLSDALRRRKPLLIAAVGLTAFARPLFALSTSILGVFTARALDRIGNGLQASPRDALIGDAAPPKHKGQAFGLRQALGLLGSTIGALFAMYWQITCCNDYKSIFWIAAIFPILALFIVIYMVRDHTQEAQEQTQRDRAKRKSLTLMVHRYNIGTLTREFWLVLFVAVLYMLTQYSGAFIILHGVKVTGIHTIGPQIMLAQNTFAMLVSYPLGRLFDRVNHRILLGVGFIIVVLANLTFYGAIDSTQVLVGAALWGLQVGMVQAIFAAKISTVTLENNRGTGFGLYYITSGSAIFISNAIIGKVSDFISLAHALLLSALMALIAIACLPLIKKQ